MGSTRWRSVRVGLAFACVAAMATLCTEFLGWLAIDRFVHDEHDDVPPLVVAAVESRAATSRPLLAGASEAAIAAWERSLDDAFWPLLNGAVVMVGEGTAHARLVRGAAVEAPRDCTSPLETDTGDEGTTTRSCRRGARWWVSTSLGAHGTLVVELEPATSVGLIRVGWAVLSVISLVPVLGVSFPVGFALGLALTRRARRRVERVVDAASSWNEARSWVRIDDGRDDELGFLARTLDTMGRRFNEALDGARRHGAAAERSRLLDDLHDHSKQSVFAARMMLGQLAARASADPALSELTDRAIEALGVALNEMSRLTHPDDAPAALRAEHLRDAVAAVAHWWGRPIAVDGADFELATSAAEVLAITREALSNAMRHAPRARVTVSWTTENGTFVLTITDDGPGFDPARAGRPTSGLATMRRRATGLGGALELTSSPGGTHVRLSLPALEAARAAPR